MYEFLTQHAFWAAVAAYWIFSAAVGAMPEPGAVGPAGYLWVYRFFHTVAGNLTTAFGGKIPGLKALIVLGLTLPLLMSTPACAAHYAVHPGSLSTADSAAYDALLVAQATIDGARAKYESGALPGDSKAALDALIRSYNVARESWLTYRGAIATNTPVDAYLARLNQNVSDLMKAIYVLQGAK
jgi:hypothetical protein